MPSVSVIILTRNRSKLLRQSIASVLAQTYADIELVVVDDASTDDTPQVLAEYGSRVRVVQHAINKGEAVSRNSGLRAATGELIAFLDDDDVYFPTKIEKQVRLLDARSDAALAYCRFWYGDSECAPISQSGVLPEGNILGELALSCVVLSHAPLTRRSAFVQVGEFDETLPSSPDWDMWLRMARAGMQFVCVQEPLVIYRQHATSLTASTEKWERAHQIILGRLFADPHLPADVLALRDKAFASSGLSVAMANYRALNHAHAQNCLTDALALDPLRYAGRALAQVIVDSAFDPRWGGPPVAFVEQVFTHLPAMAQASLPFQAEAESMARARAALRLFAQGRMPEAQQALAEFMACLPGQLDAASLFMKELEGATQTLALDAPDVYVRQVFHHLPPQAAALQRLRPHALANVNIASAFIAFHTGKYAQVPKPVIGALVQRPSLALNRGVWSILLQSLMR